MKGMYVIMKNMLIIAIIILGIGLTLGVVFLVIGLAVTNNKNKKNERCTSKTSGKVINMAQRCYKRMGIDDYSNFAWHPVIEYQIGETKVEKEYNFGSGKPKYEIGQKIQIYYNPQNYNEYYIEGDNVQTIVAKGFTIAGITLVCLTIFSVALILCNIKN